MAFTSAEVEYLRSHPMGRIATVGPDGQPDVVPVAVEFDEVFFWVGGGDTFLATRKVQHIRDGRDRVALVIDDMPSFDPFVARGIRIYGRADGPIERAGMVGPGHYLRIVPTTSWSWNLEGEPVGEHWYPTRKTRHQDPAG